MLTGQEDVALHEITETTLWISYCGQKIWL